MDLVEIVPLDKNLIAEVKVSPKDIAFIYPGQKALVKFTAYDFAIYGGLTGKVVGISPDTVTDKKDRTFYIVRIETSDNNLVLNGQRLKIIPGMVVNVDIITGKRTILDYLLKPMLNSKDYIFTEH
jgi:adhesin transport system membrane fusion protein